jgi:putative membrane protein
VIRRLLVAWLVMAVAVAITVGLLPGVHVDGGAGAFLLIALVWGLVDGILGPIARLLSLPITLLTFGLFVLVVNGLLFVVTDVFVSALHVDNFLWAIAAAFVLSVVTWLLHAILDRARERRRRARI